MGLGFLICGTLTILTLKSLFKEFYDNNLKVLIFAVISLSLPLITRGGLGLALGYNNSVREYAYFYRIRFDACFYIVGTVIPVGC